MTSRKMLVSENFGDYVMTEEFARYVNAAGFEPVFCMPYDPASKGQSEAVVKYVKNNFLAGRTYVNIESLNDEAIGWLSRTANAKVNSSTRLIPAEEFKKEQPMLALYVEEIEEPEMEAREYSVRKDNTLLYHSNFYSLPLGTYDGQGTKVLVIKNVDSNELEIYDPKDFGLIARHKISPFRGKYINKDEHASSLRVIFLVWLFVRLRCFLYAKFAFCTSRYFVLGRCSLSLELNSHIMKYDFSIPSLPSPLLSYLVCPVTKTAHLSLIFSPVFL